MKETMIRDMTKGPLFRQLVTYSVPIIVGNILQSLYNVVDMLIVGNYVGAGGLAAAGIGGLMQMLVMMIGMALGFGGQILLSQQVGAGEKENIRRTIGTLLSITFLSAVALGVVGLVLTDLMMKLLNTPAAVWADTRRYYRTCCFGVIFVYGYNGLGSILRGLGQSKLPTVFVAIASVLNILLDYVFVARTSMGVAGAALATVIAQGVSFLFSLTYLVLHRESFGFDFRPSSFVPDRHAASRLVALGIPMTIQSAAIHFSKIVLARWINASGVVYSALAGIYNKIGIMSGIVSNSFTAAGSSMVGQNLGAGKTERVPVILRVVFICGTVISTVFTAVLLLWPREIYSLFTTDAPVLAAAGVLTLPTILNFYGSATRSVAFSIINGSGNTKLNLAVALIDGMISRISIAALLGFAAGMGCQGFWCGDAISGFVPICIGLWYLLTGRWRKARRAMS